MHHIQAIMIQPDLYYQQKKIALSNSLAKLLQKKGRLGISRFLSLLAIIPTIYYLYPYSHPLSIFVIILFLCLFGFLVFVDTNNNNSITHLQHLHDINDREINALQGDFSCFENGAPFIPKHHPYANDLDILGTASIYQMINRTSSDMGAASLANWLLYPALPAHIIERQIAIKELGSQPEWQQRFHAYGQEKRISESTKERLISWLNEPSSFIGNTFWEIARYLIPGILFLAILLNIFSVISNPTRNYFILAAAILAFYIAGKIKNAYQKVARIAAEMEVMSDSIRWIEQSKFKSDLLLSLQDAYLENGHYASKAMKQLKGIVARLDYRLNPVVFIPLAILLQWDLQQIIGLENWKKKYKEKVVNWFCTLGELETINSFATLHFNHPEWCFPELLSEHFSMNGKQVGHPLIKAESRVNNDIHIGHKKELMLITGSNMAGKSTYLRSIGINVVFAMAGAPVCAESFSLSPVQLITSMRITDNLEENTSTFYAELKKLKEVIERVNQKEKVFILLDEILRGTNSLDRHTGSKALIQQLIEQEAIGIIATHDVELSKLKAEYPDNLFNYYFDAAIQSDELFFDYLLKEGVCASLNASILMRKIGIRI